MKETKNKVKSFFKGDDTKQQSKTTKNLLILLVLVVLELTVFNFRFYQNMFNQPFSINETQFNTFGLVSQGNGVNRVTDSEAFVEAYKYLGLYMVIFYAALIGVPDELGEAALIDGAAVWQEYLYVKIPYIKPVIIANCLLVLNGSLRSFEFSYLLTHGGPGNASELMTTYMYKQAFSSMKYGYGSAVAIMIVIICMVVGLLFRKFSGEGEDE